MDHKSILLKEASDKQELMNWDALMSDGHIVNYTGLKSNRKAKYPSMNITKMGIK